MGDLSEHFNHKDFVCRCNYCRQEGFKIHLGLVGVLERIADHFNKKINIVSAFWCDDYYSTLKKERRSYHTMGKAVHINIEEVPLPEIFKYAETISDLDGIGLYPKEGFIHLDTRPKEKRALWIKEGIGYTILTPEKRKQWNL